MSDPLTSRRPAPAPGVIVLAGGFGTRVSHLLPGIPKPMAPVAGRPFVEWIIRYFVKQGCSQFVLATGHLSEVVEAHFKSQPVSGAHVTCRPEKTPLGTAGGCLNALPSRPSGPDATWLVVNGDSLVFADSRPLVESLRNGADAAILGLRLEEASRYGSLDIRDDGVLNAFREKTPGPGVINTGVYAFTEACLRSLPDRRPLSFEFDVFPPLAASGRVRVVTTDAPFLDIGTPATLNEAERFIRANNARFQ